MSSAVSPRQKALWATRREASSIKETRYVLRSWPLIATRGPCITSPYQMEPANSAVKLRFSCGRLADPRSWDRPLCCSRRCTLERDRLCSGATPALTSKRSIWLIERRGFSRLAANMASCTAADILERPRSMRTLGTKASMPPLRQA